MRRCLGNLGATSGCRIRNWHTFVEKRQRVFDLRRNRPGLDFLLRPKRRMLSLTFERFEELFRTYLRETYHRRAIVEGRHSPLERIET
jgi:hypothetical protein